MVVETEYGVERLLADLEMQFPDRPTRAVCFGYPSPAADLPKTNAYLAEAGRKDQLLPLMIVGRDTVDAAKLEDEVRRGGFFGFKVLLNWIGDDYGDVGVFDMIGPAEMRIADELSLIVLFHLPGADRLADKRIQQDLRRLAGEYGRAKIVLAHCGRCYLPDRMKSAVGSVADLNNIFLDTSMVMDPTVLQIAMDGVGAQRLLFGTDLPVAAMRGRRVYVMDHWVDVVAGGYPASDYRLASDEIRATFMTWEIVLAIRRAAELVGLSDKQMKSIFWDNGMSLLRQVESGAGI